jgi:starvation-inducible outer membrane lipoprotein
MTMGRWLLLMGFLFGLAACATAPQPYIKAPEGSEANQQKDHVECLALAAQAAQGAGGFTSVAPVQAAFYDEAKQRYYVQCLQGRGYTLAYR